MNISSLFDLIDMKTIIIIMMLFIGSKVEPIQIQGLKKEYKRIEKINYSICNTSESDIFINIALEANVNNKWEEVIIDITKETVKAAFIYEIKRDHSKCFIFDLKRIDRALFKDKQVEIRLKAYYGTKAKNTTDILYSNKIVVKYE